MRDHSAVGDRITTHCTQCQLRHVHKIVAMDGTRMAKVTCTICGGVAMFTPAGSHSKARGACAKKDGNVPPSVEPRWQAKMAVATGTERQ
jgi:hypothetical protein